MIQVLDSLFIQVSPHLHMARWEWRGTMSYSCFQQAFERLLDVSHEHQLNRWLADIGTMPLIGIDEQTWLSEIWLPRFSTLGVQYLALIEPASMHNQLVIDSILSEGLRYTKTNVQFFTDIAAALDWLTKSTTPLMENLEREWQAALPPSQRIYRNAMRQLWEVGR
jgi:hypothetical protein